MIYKTFEQWMNSDFLEVGEPRKKAYSKDELLLVEMGWNYGYDAGRAVEQALDKKAENARELGLDYEPVQEPVAIALNTGTKQGVKWLKNVEHGEKLYTTPPAAQRTWVGLTEDERDTILRSENSIFDMTEAILKAKNT
jgi:hypothetical protein